MVLHAGSAWSALLPAERSAEISAVARQPLDRRLLSVSARFLGTPYLHSPLGEGQGVDPDPRIRFDAVDCLTFVEETMALSLAGRAEALLPTLDRIRYAASPSYASRNHLMEAEWLPGNTAKGYVRDVTSSLAGADALTAEKVLSTETWKGAEGRRLALPQEARVQGRFPLPLLPLARVLAHAQDFPSGTLLLVVREDRPALVTRVSHLGFVVQRGGKTFLRHATRGRSNAVVDEELGHLLARHARYPWKVVGVSLWQVEDPGSNLRASHPPSPAPRPRRPVPRPACRGSAAPSRR